MGPNDIAAIYIGANDILFNATITAQQVSRVIDGQICRLVAAGGKGIILANYPYLNLLPAEASLPTNESNPVKNFSTQLTAELKEIIAKWKGTIHIGLADIQVLAVDIFDRPTHYGLDPKTLNPPTACVTGVYEGEGPVRKFCKHPNRHFFFDNYHPTYPIHEQMANVFIEVIEEFCTEN
jgi:phospholipase/lecithinase/hemolysin